MKNKGITLLALIVTVIIMIILAGVSIKIITSGGIIDKTRESAIEFQKQADYEEFLLAVTGSKEYFEGAVNVENLKSTLGEGWKVEEKDGMIQCTSINGNEFEIEEMTDIINPEILVEVEDGFGNTYIYYRLDKATEDEIIECKKRGIPPFLGDVNCDGIVDGEDVSKVSRDIGGSVSLTPEEKKYADMNKDNDISPIDLTTISGFVIDKTFQRMYAVARELGIDYAETMIEDEENGILYYIENNVTLVQAKELEKYGVKKTMYGDVDFDGELTMNDYKILKQAVSGVVDLAEKQIIIGDMDQDEDITTIDVSLVKSKLIELGKWEDEVE